MRCKEVHGGRVSRVAMACASESLVRPAIRWNMTIANKCTTKLPSVVLYWVGWWLVVGVFGVTVARHRTSCNRQLVSSGVFRICQPVDIHDMFNKFKIFPCSGVSSHELRSQLLNAGGTMPWIVWACLHV